MPHTLERRRTLSSAPVRRRWLFAAARELQVLAGALLDTDVALRPRLIDRVVGGIAPPESDLERWFLAQFIKAATRTVADAPRAGERDRPVPSRSMALTTAVAGLLRNRYAEPWTLRLVADAMRRHPSTIEREMKRAFGVSLHGFLTACRMEAAKQLLATSDLKIEAVAREVGYRGKKNFYDEFRRATGVTPLAFRRRLRPPPDE